MSEFSVKFQDVINEEKNLKNYADHLSDISSQITKIRNSLSFEIGSRERIASRLASLSSIAERQGKNLVTLGNTVEQIKNTYSKTEQLLKDGSYFINEGDWSDKSSKVTKGKEKFKKSIVKKKKKTRKAGYYDKDGWHDRTPKKDDNGYDKKGYYDKDGKWHDGDDPDKKSKDYIPDINVIGIKGTAEAALLKLEGGNENSSYSVKIGAAEAHGEIYAGLYGFDEDGNKVFKPGIDGAIGASVVALSAEGMAIIGDDMLGAYAGGDVAAGKLSAQAEGKLGFGKDGFNAYAKASAEAIAVEANANVGAKILGTDIKGEVGVNVGVGAHAEVGYHDGKISLDVGASLGVGVSAKLEIDVSGTVDMVVDAAQGIVDSVANVGNAIAGWFSW